VSVLTDVTELKKTGKLMSEAAMRCTHGIREPLATVRSYLALLLDESVGNLNHRQRLMLTQMIKREEYISLSDLDTDFGDEITREPGGESIRQCFSCGTCIAACPVGWINDEYNPRRIIRMVLLGMREQVLKSKFIWLCSTCYTCHEWCPQEMKVTEVMNALRNIASREGYAHLAYVRQIGNIRSLGRLYEIDDFDNKRREKLGLPRISTDPSEISQIFEITGINEIIQLAQAKTKISSTMKTGTRIAIKPAFERPPPSQ